MMRVMHKPTRIVTSPGAQVAIASLSIELGAGAAPSEIRLIPAGPFRSVDGRPADVAAWVLDDAHAAQIVATVNARQSACVIDFEHQTLLSRENGKPAPAAGWYSQVEWRPAAGLYATDVEWTAEAAAMIESRQYRFISPVFSWNKQTGAVLALAHAALTNNPGLDGLTDLSALASQLFPTASLTQENPMDDLLEQLRWLLNLPVGATADDATAQLQKLIDQIKADPELAPQAATSFDLAAYLGAQGTEIAALKAIAAKATTAPDPAKFVEITMLSAVQGELASANTELAALKAEKLDAEVDKVVADALNAGKLSPATEAWARNLGKTNLAALTSFVEAAPVVAKPGSTQSGGNGPAGGTDTTSPQAIAALARTYQDEQAALGITVSAHAAVAHVTSN